MEELDPITIVVGSNYTEDPPQESGYTTYVNGTVDTSTPGVYVITYTLMRLEPTFDTKTYTKEVTVTAVPPSTVTITLNGDPVISIPLADVATYSDAGATSSDGTVYVTNLDGTSSESFTGLPSVAGSYTLFYYVSGSVSTFVTRTIHVLGNNVAPSDPIPTSGPTDLDTDVVPPIEVPTTGPTDLSTTYVPVQKPAIGFPIVTIDTDQNISKPLAGFPIVTLDTSDRPEAGFPITSIEVENNTVKPATGYPVTSIDTDETGNRPASSYPIESISST